MRRTLRGQRILVTGATSGIGRGIAEEAARAGMRVLATGRSSEALQELVQSLTAQGHEAIAEPADVTVAADRQRLLQTAVDRFGGLDVLLNNAGIGSQGQFVQSSEAILRQIMEVNFFASAELIRLAVPLLEKGRQPAVVQIASMTGRRAMPFWSEYSASKYAVCGLIETLRAELARYDIDVLLIVPGITNTNLWRRLMQNRGMVIRHEKGMSTEYVGRQTIRALERNRSETVLGLEARWMIRAQRWFPRIVDTCLSMYVRRRMRKEAKA